MGLGLWLLTCLVVLTRWSWFFSVLLSGSLDLLPSYASDCVLSLPIAVYEKRGVEGEVVFDGDSRVDKPRCDETEAQVVAGLRVVPLRISFAVVVNSSTTFGSWRNLLTESMHWEEEPCRVLTRRRSLPFFIFSLL